MLGHKKKHKQQNRWDAVAMKTMRPGLFLQREGPGSELGNSLWHPDVSLEAAVLLYGVLGAFSVERAYCITSITRPQLNT